MPESSHERTLFKVIIFCSALALGGLGAIIGSTKDFFHGDAALQLSWKTPAGFVAGFAVGWLFWRVLRAMMNKAD
jgi:NhaP-type Na+/H+ or K+/H+ antiporter